MSPGKPPLFKDQKTLELAIKKYFLNVPKKKVPYSKGVLEYEVPTITGLAHFLGFASRQSFYDYEKHERYSYVIKRARLLIERHYEELAQIGNGAGAIFILKNMGWTDKPDEDRHTSIVVKWDDFIGKNAQKTKNNEKNNEKDEANE